MNLPPQPGVYVVEMLNEHPISVNSDRPAIADRCIKVTKENCKYGQAVNLARRQRDYFKTFGAQYVRFRYFAVTPYYSMIEAEVGERLRKFRLLGQTGRLNEWLHGISPEEVERIVRSSVESRFNLEQEVHVQANLQENRIEVRQISGVSPGQLIEAARYLEGRGMSVSFLRDIHHSPHRGETFGSTFRYFSGKMNLLQKNIQYGARLVYIAEQHRICGRAFQELVEEALKIIPK